MLRLARPDDAARLAEHLKSNELLRLSNALEVQLTLPSPSRALLQCWALEAEGKPAEAQQVLKKAAADHLPLPFLTNQ